MVPLNNNTIAHWTVFIRILLVFVVIFLFTLPSFFANVAGVLLLIVAAVLDGVDGYLARKYNASSLVGGMLDTLGDRITENVLLIFFACERLIPFYVPIVFVARSLTSDFIRFLWVKQQVSTFAMQTSKLGRILVSSKTSRVIYLMAKIGLFLLGGVIISLERLAAYPDMVARLGNILWSGAIILLAFNLVRFFLLLYDSRELLQKELVK
ncbi:MAG: CDP-alcohol phosphatidyltransferase family protein [Candidatus Omnitrophica bacterium]|nr:CDP-alcohol phosphatidyltransferase family protein [Candidatus Omnitrophota bacterium]MBU1924998.1 CDP-alcohol phosphatidyltransferase family protein [Candidatus Omnitrophota bacterium]